MKYHYTYDDRGFITAEDAIESLYGYAWDDKHDGKHENWHDTLYPHGDKHYNKHDKDGLYGFQIVETKRAFEYDDDGKLLSATENEDRQGRYDYTFRYDDMGNRTFYAKSRNGKVQESAEYTYNSANQPIKVKQYDGKHYKTVEYSYDADGNRILEEEVKPDGTRKVEKSYEYTVENRLKAVSDKNDLLAAMAYDGDGNRIFQLNYNLHTDDDWKGNSGNGNGNNKDNPGSGNSGNNSGNGTGSKTKAASEETAASVEETTESQPGFWENIVSFFTGEKEEETEAPVATSSNAYARKNDKPNGNNGNGNGNKPDKPNKPNDNTSTGGTNDNNGNANGNTNNTGGSQNQSGILFPIDGEVSELEGELIDRIKTTGKQKNYELVEYVNDVNREHTEVLMELNINGIMDTAYSYGDQRLTNERFTEWTGYYTYDPRGSVTGVTDDKGMIWQSYRYDAFGSMTFGQPQYNNVYSYNAESYNPNVDTQYLRARYYSPTTADFISEDSYLGDITDPLTLNRYNYVKSSPLNYIDPSGHKELTFRDVVTQYGLHHDQFGLDIGAWYLYGNGESFVIKDEPGNQPDTWRDYLESNDILTGEVGDVVVPIGDNLSNNSSLEIDMSFQMIIENGEGATGYEFMHATNGDAGHFQIKGTVSKNNKGDAFYDLEYTWNDIMDPFPEAYGSDGQKAEIAKKIPLANPQDFEFHVSWSDKTVIRSNPGWVFNRNSGWLKNWSTDWYSKLSENDKEKFKTIDFEQVNKFSDLTWKQRLEVIKEMYPHYYEGC